MNYEMLVQAANNNGLVVKEKPLKYNNGRIKGNRIAIRKDIETQIEKSCVLAEELGHYYTTSGNILDQSNTMNRKQEYRARLWGYNLKIGLAGIVKAYKQACKSAHEMADYLDVTEEYLEEAIQCYRSKYGLYTFFDNCIIYFQPSIMVAEITERNFALSHFQID